MQQHTLNSHNFCCVKRTSRRTLKQKARRSTLSTLVPCSVSFAAVAAAAATATACCLLLLLLLLLLFQRTRTSCSKSSSHRRLLFVLFCFVSSLSFARRRVVAEDACVCDSVCVVVLVVVAVCVFVCVCN